MDRRYWLVALTVVATGTAQLSLALERYGWANPFVQLGAGLLLGLSMVMGSAAIRMRSGLEGGASA